MPMTGQISLDEFSYEPKPGDWVEYSGRLLTEPEIRASQGELVILDMSTISHKWYKVCRLERITKYGDEPSRCILYDGKSQRSLGSTAGTI